jgi:Ca-activated chloride channel family protein
MSTPWAELGRAFAFDAVGEPTRGALLAAVALLGLVAGLWPRSDGLIHPAWRELSQAGVRSAWPSRALRAGLRTSVLMLLAWAAAEPIALRPSPPEVGRGLDILLALDTSGSMRALDTSGHVRALDPSSGMRALDTQPTPATADDAAGTQTRLELAVEAVRRFAKTRVAEGDRVGLVVFGDHAFTLCPLTRDGRVLDAVLEDVRAEMAGRRTALGDALALSVKRLGAAASGAEAGRIVVLLTDGRSTAGEVPPGIASDLARAHGVRVHTVGIGSELAQVAVAAGPAGRVRLERHAPDFDVLSLIAADTGGRFHRARRSSDLAAVYREIDALERVERPEPRPPREQPRSEPALAAALLLLAVDIGVVRLRRSPLS